MRRLNAQDDRWLAIDTPENPYQIGALCFFETDAEHRPGDFYPAVRAHLKRRLPSTPLLVRHQPSPFHFDTGLWLEVEDCDLDEHVIRVDADREWTRAELHAFVAEQAMRRWDFDRPPFRVFVFDRVSLEGAAPRVALMLQTHHALADGVGFQSIVRACTDDAADARPPERSPTAERAPDALSWLASSARRFAQEALERRAGRADRERAREELAEFRARPGTRRARTPVIEGLSLEPTRQRVYESFSLPLEGFRTASRALGGTVNDAFLTVTGGAARRFLEERGLLDALDDQPLVGLGARSLRRPEHGDYGNYIALLLPQLGTHLADPVERFRTVHTSMRAELERSDLTQRLLDTDDRPFGARRRRAGPEEGTSAGNVSASNVPGPAEPRYLAGYRMLANHPAPNLPAGQLFNVTLRRYVDSLDFGLVCSPSAIADASSIREAFVESLGELVEAAGDDSPSVPPPE